MTCAPRSPKCAGRSGPDAVILSSGQASGREVESGRRDRFRFAARQRETDRATAPHYRRTPCAASISRDQTCLVATVARGRAVRITRGRRAAEAPGAGRQATLAEEVGSRRMLGAAATHLERHVAPLATAGRDGKNSPGSGCQTTCRSRSPATISISPPRACTRSRRSRPPPRPAGPAPSDRSPTSDATGATGASP